MKTKIVYAVSSDEQDIYLEQAALSAFSLKRHNPDVVVELIVDRKTDMTIVGNRKLILKYINNKIVVNVPKEYDKKQTSRFLKTNIRQYVNGDYLFIDSDTVITDNLCEIDSFDGDIGAVINEHVPISQYYNYYGPLIKKIARQEGWVCSDDIKYFNSGVLYVKDTDLTRQFCTDWHETWKESLRKYGRIYDQPPLALVNEKYGYLIKELPGVWNCQIMTFALHYLFDAKIIHYFSIKKDYKNKLVYAFRDKLIYQRIRENGYISEDIKLLVNRAKTAFINPTRVCIHSELSLLSGEMAQVCQRHKKITTILNSAFRLLIKLNAFLMDLKLRNKK